MKNTRLTDLIATRNDDIGIENYRIRFKGPYSFEH